MDPVQYWVSSMRERLFREGTVVFAVHVSPRAKETKIIGLNARQELKIKVAEPPTAGRANHAVLRVLATEFAVPLRQVEIRAGMTARRKQVRITL